MAAREAIVGPTLELRITTTRFCRACDLYETIAEVIAGNEGETRVTVDWNGLHARPWDMSFVLLILERTE